MTTTETAFSHSLSPSAALSYMNDEIVYIQQIHIGNKDKLLARKIVDSRLIHSIDNLKDILQMLYLHKLPIEMRYTLFLSIDRMMDYLFLATQNDWPVDRDLEKEIGVLELFKANFAHYLAQIIHFITKKQQQTTTTTTAIVDSAAIVIAPTTNNFFANRRRIQILSTFADHQPRQFEHNAPNEQRRGHCAFYSVYLIRMQ